MPDCETCTERGRKTPGTDRGKIGVMCDGCFRGKGEKREHRAESSYPPDNKVLRSEMRQVDRKRRSKKAAPKSKV